MAEKPAARPPPAGGEERLTSLVTAVVEIRRELDLVKSQLSQPKIAPTVRRVREVVADLFEIDPGRLSGRTRSIAAYLSHRLTTCRPSAISQILGYKHQASVNGAIESVSERRLKDSKFDQQIAGLEATLTNVPTNETKTDQP